MLDMISKQKRSNVSNLLRSVIDAYLKYMDKAFLHPGEQDVMARLQKLEDRLVKLNLKGLHATGRILYMVGVAWKMGHNQEPLTTERFEELMEKSKNFSANWLDNRPGPGETKAS